MSEQLAAEYYNAGLSYTKSGELDKAQEALNKAIAEDPKHVKSYNALGMVYRQQGELDEARKCWRAALKIEPNNTTARQSLEATRGPAQIPIKTLLWVAAVAALVLAALIITTVIQFQRITSLEKELELAKSETPESQDPEFVVEDERKQPATPTEEAVIQSAPKTKPPIWTTNSISPTKSLGITEIYDQALVNCRSGWYDQAMEGFQKVLEHSSAHDLKDNAQYWLGECYYAQKEYKKALDEFQKVKINFPTGNKVFDADLKIAYIYYKLDSAELARLKLSQISRDWPHEKYRSQIQVLSAEIRSGQAE